MSAWSWNPYRWRPTTQLAVRAALAVALATVVTSVANLGHNWWAVMTTLLLISQSWGESIQRASKRFVMTVIGCSVGWGLYWLLGPHTFWSLVVIGSCLFVLMYCAPTWYATMMFCVGILVVFLFGALTVWDSTLWWQRIAQTGLGCVVVIVVSRFVLPALSQNDLNQRLQTALKSLERLTGQLLWPAEGVVMPQAELASAIQDLSAELVALQPLATVVRYERILMLRSSNRMEQVLTKLEVIAYYLGTLQHTMALASQRPITEYFAAECAEIAQHIRHRFQQLHAAEAGEAVVALPSWESVNLPKLRERWRAAWQHHLFEPEAFVETSAYLYYCRRLDAELLALTGLLRGCKL